MAVSSCRLYPVNARTVRLRLPMGSCHDFIPPVPCPVVSLILHSGILLCSYRYATQKFRGNKLSLESPLTNGREVQMDRCFLLCLQGKHFWDAIHKTPWKVLADQELAAHRDGQLNTSLCWLCLLPVLLFPSCSLALYESYPKITYLQGYFCLRFVWKPRLS